MIEKLRAEILFGHGGQKKICVRISYLVISDLFGDIYIYIFLYLSLVAKHVYPHFV